MGRVRCGQAMNRVSKDRSLRCKKSAPNLGLISVRTRTLSQNERQLLKHHIRCDCLSVAHGLVRDDPHDLHLPGGGIAKLGLAENSRLCSRISDGLRKGHELLLRQLQRAR